MKKILEVKNINKSYQHNKAINNLSFNVYDGEILGLLGPNGAGKSTTINILSTLLTSDTGTINIFNLPLTSHSNKIKAQLGIVPQEIALYEDISAYHNVAFFASLYGVKKKDLPKQVMNALTFVGLSDKKNDDPRTFSGGMKRRLNIACAIAHNPKLLILDEPTVGIDPQSRNYILSSLKELKEKGTTIIYTTHYMEEVEQICSRIAIIDHGHVLATGTCEELKNMIKTGETITIEAINLNPETLSEIRTMPNVFELTYEEQVLKIRLSGGKHNLISLLKYLGDHNISFGRVFSELPTLNDVFLEITGKELRD